MFVIHRLTYVYGILLTAHQQAKTRYDNIWIYLYRQICEASLAFPQLGYRLPFCMQTVCRMVVLMGLENSIILLYELIYRHIAVLTVHENIKPMS